MSVILIILIVLFGKNTKMSKKIVVLGSLGMAGHIMTEYLDSIEDYDVYGVARQTGRFVSKVLDVTDFKALREYLDLMEPDYVINCIGALVSHSKENPSNAILLNSYLPHFLSEVGDKLNYQLIHISTDCVFSGKEGGYTEDSFKDGDDYYARTKALGEIVNNKDLTIRTSIIGPELKENGTGLLDWFLKQSENIKGYTQAYWSGVTTLELAKAVDVIIKQDLIGLYHLCPAEKISKFELLKLFSEIWESKFEIVPYENYQVDKSLVCTRKDFKYPTPTYKNMLIELKQWMDNHSNYYVHYK